MKLPTIAELRKFLIALSATITILLTQAFVAGTVNHWLTVAASVVGALLVYLVPNKAAPGNEASAQ